MSEIAIILSGISAFAGALVYRGGAWASQKWAEKLKRKYEKNKLKTELQNSIQNLTLCCLE